MKPVILKHVFCAESAVFGSEPGCHRLARKSHVFVLWWQIKRTRTLGFRLLFAGAIVATWLAIGMHWQFVNGSAFRDFSAKRNRGRFRPRFFQFQESTPGRIRTSNPRFRRPMLYPIEPRVHLENVSTWLNLVRRKDSTIAKIYHNANWWSS